MGWLLYFVCMLVYVVLVVIVYDYIKGPIDLIAYSWFDSKIIYFWHFVYLSYFPYSEQNGSSSMQELSIRKDKEFDYNFLKIYRYLNLVKTRRITL
jgi:hypothetical protein